MDDGQSQDVHSPAGAGSLGRKAPSGRGEMHQALQKKFANNR